MKKQIIDLYFIKQISRTFAAIDKKCLCFKLAAVSLDIHSSLLKNVQQNCLLWETGYNVLRYKAESRFVLYGSVRFKDLGDHWLA